jgi:hypothetical protein
VAVEGGVPSVEEMAVEGSLVNGSAVEGLLVSGLKVLGLLVSGSDEGRGFAVEEMAVEGSLVNGSAVEGLLVSGFSVVSWLEQGTHVFSLNEIFATTQIRDTWIGEHAFKATLLPFIVTGKPPALIPEVHVASEYIW